MSCDDEMWREGGPRGNDEDNDGGGGSGGSGNGCGGNGGDFGDDGDQRLVRHRAAADGSGA